jgi:ABC-2 type transport system ATP-binding protein
MVVSGAGIHHIGRVDETVIKAVALSKRYETVLAVDHIDIAVPRGMTAALLGGNGAGKTTTLSMLLGLLVPTSGTVEVLGVDMVRRRYDALPRMNFSSPYVELPNRLTVKENLTVFGRLYGVRRLGERIAALAESLALTPLLDRPIGRLSAGQKTRVALAKSLINQPDVLLLDEPTASLDPDTADWVRSHLERYRRERRAAILLASHNMPEVERLCDNVLMMKAGKIVDQGTPAELITRYGRETMEDVFLDVARGRDREAAE